MSLPAIMNPQRDSWLCMCVFVYVCLFPSHKLKMATKLRTEYGPVLHMPVLKEGKSKVASHALDPYDSTGYTSAGKCVRLTVCKLIIDCPLCRVFAGAAQLPWTEMLQRGFLYLVFVFSPEIDPEYLITGTHPYPSAPGSSRTLILMAKPCALINLTQCLIMFRSCSHCRYSTAEDA